ncbi:MAG: DUF3817 domain-containing protein [Solirubrobacterales bacterium]|nr:DUF3817 domain-containing protein [Solirubrobacterales bacterium]
MRRLNLIAVIAVADAVLLAVLLWASFGDRDGAVSVLGPIHGIGFLALLYLCARGAGEGRWGWWFPLIVVLTAGPLGSLIGDWIVRRHLADLPAAPARG